MSAEISMILDSVKSRWIKLGKGRMGILAMQTFLVAIHPSHLRLTLLTRPLPKSPAN